MASGFGGLGYTLVFVWLTLSATWAEDGSSLDAEAVEVLRAASAVEPYGIPGSSPCRIVAEWSKTAVPMDIAREVFGLHVRADLVASEPVPDSTAILTTVDPDPAHLCSYDKMRHQRSQFFTEAPILSRYYSHVWKYSFPVFNSTFTKAVVVWTDLYDGSRKGVAGVEGTGFAFTATALVFVRRGRVWHLTKRDVIGQT